MLVRNSLGTAGLWSVWNISIMKARIIAVPIGIVISLMGLVWLLQGIGILPGTFMNRSQFWSIAGATAIFVGLIVTILGFRRREPVQ